MGGFFEAIMQRRRTKTRRLFFSSILKQIVNIDEINSDKY